MPAQDQAEFATRRRSELFDALVALFLQRGFSQLTLDEIAAELHCSKSTLYTLAATKAQLVRAATIHFFREATIAVEAATQAEPDITRRVAAYLAAVGDALTPASQLFMADLDAFAPAREIYEQNTRLAAERVHRLIDDGVQAGVFRDVHAAFAADMVTTMMVRIQQRLVVEHTGLDDASAYRELAALITAGISK